MATADILTAGTPAAMTRKTWKDLSGISYEFNAHVNTAYNLYHNALNDTYADTLDLTDLEPLFTDDTFATFKTQSADGVNAVRLLSDIIYSRIAAVSTPGSMNSDRIGEILETCSLSFVNQTGSRKTFRTIDHFNQLLKATLSNGQDYAIIRINIHGLYFHPLFSPSGFDGVSLAPFRRSTVLPTDGMPAPTFALAALQWSRRRRNATFIAVALMYIIYVLTFSPSLVSQEASTLEKAGPASPESLLPSDILSTDSTDILATLPMPDTSAVQPYIDFMVSSLYHSVPDRNLTAFTETELPVNDDMWWWIDDNAKGLEVFALPGVLDQHEAKVNEVVKFIDELSPGPFFFRRVSKKMLYLKKSDLRDFDILTGMFRFWGNLEDGMMFMGVKFHDGRDLPAFAFGTAFVSFTFGGEEYLVNSEDFPVSASIMPVSEDILLRRSFSITIKDVPVCTLVIDIVVSNNNVHPKRNVILRSEPGITLENVEIAVGYQQMSSLGANYQNTHVTTLLGGHVAIERKPDDGEHCTTFVRDGIIIEPANQDITLYEGAMKWFAVYQAGNIGFSYSIVTIPDQPENVLRVTSHSAICNGLQKVMTWHRMGTVTPTRDVRTSEQIVLTAGGLYPEFWLYDPIFADMQKWTNADLSISYDYGAEVHSISMIWLADVMAKGFFRYESTWSIDWIKEKIVAFDHSFLAHDSYIFSRGLSYMTVACENFYRVTGDPFFFRQFQRFISTIVSFGRNEGDVIFYPHNPVASVFVDTQSSCIWALSRAALFTKNQVYADLARKGFPAFIVNLESTELGGKIKVKEDSIHWSFKAGLLLRSAEAFKVASEVLLKDMLTKREVAHVEEVIKLSREYLRSCEKKHDSGIEILTSAESAETNSETQPWTLLPQALPDNLAYRIGQRSSH